MQFVLSTYCGVALAFGRERQNCVAQNRKRDIANVLHYAANDNVNVLPNVVNDIEKIEDGEPPSKYQRSDDSNVSVHDDLDLFSWLNNMF